jgi:hypothetical protein
MRRMRITTTLLSAALAALVFAASANASTFKQFHSPSGNINCGMGGGFVRCDITEHTWTSPPQPATCEFDWGGSVGVGRKDPASFLCVSDAVGGPDSQVLGYGEKIYKNRFSCSSKQKGMRCVNHKSGHGFAVSREKVRLF